MVPPDTVPTVQPRWVHTAVNALNEPAFGWVITIFGPVRILPPPTGMSVVLASTVDPFEPPGLAGAPDEEPAGADWPSAIPLLQWLRGDPASAAAPAAPAQASRARRLDVRTLGSAMPG